jgi:ABC-2 type transport system permease protein
MNRTHLLRVARLDLTLLLRNKTALFIVVGMPLLFTVMLIPSRGNDLDGVDLALLQGTGYLGFFLIFAVFMHLVAVFTARREDLTLKRMRGTALSDAEVTGGAVLTAVGMYAVQALVLLAVLGIAVGGRFPADPVLMLAGLAGGAAVFALLGFAVAGLTPTYELSQLTVLPIMFACMIGAGVMFPLDGLPAWAEQACRALPLTPVVEIVRTGYFGRDFADYAAQAPVGIAEGWTACLRPFLVLAAWLVAGRAMAARWFRWEPRRA